MKRLLMLLTLLLSTCLVAQELNEEQDTYTYENYEFNVAFDLGKDWYKSMDEVEDGELLASFLSPTKKQLTVSVQSVDPEMSLEEFVTSELASQEEKTSFEVKEKCIETVTVGEKEMMHLTAVLNFEWFSVKTHAYFYIENERGFYWAMFSQNLNVDFQDELEQIVATFRSIPQSLPVLGDQEDVVSTEEALSQCNICDEDCAQGAIFEDAVAVSEDEQEEESLVSQDQESIVEESDEEVAVASEDDSVVAEESDEEVALAEESEELVVELLDVVKDTFDLVAPEEATEDFALDESEQAEEEA